MLMKLIKYEFSANAKTYIPLYILLVIISIVNGFSLNLSKYNFSQSQIPQTIIMLLYISIIIAVIITTAVFGITRFKKNILGDEGYLMLTLPVSREQLVLSKLISAICWIILSTLVSILSVVIIATPGIDNFINLLKEVVSGFGELLEMIFITNSVGEVVYTFCIVVLMLLFNLAIGYLLIYLAMVIGHTFNKYKTYMSVAAYVVLSIGYSVATDIVSDLLSSISNIDLRLSALCVVLAVASGLIFYAITYVLKNRVNLE